MTMGNDTSSSTYTTVPLTFGDEPNMVDLSNSDSVQLGLHGVHHSARPTWKLKETVEFYHEILGLPIVHCITARGWGRGGHPDFLHFFFDSGCGSVIAFFYYLGTDRPNDIRPADEILFRATHIAWAVESKDELLQWKKTLEHRGIDVSPVSHHEIIHSIYFTDPNGYPLEVSYQTRDINELDSIDAEDTLRASIQLESDRSDAGQKIGSIDEVWNRKASLRSVEHDESSIEIFVLDVPEFKPLVDSAYEKAECEVSKSEDGYFRIHSKSKLVFERKKLGLKPAVWYGLFTGGLKGRIESYGREEVHLSPV